MLFIFEKRGGANEVGGWRALARTKPCYQTGHGKFLHSLHDKYAIMFAHRLPQHVLTTEPMHD